MLTACLVDAPASRRILRQLLEEQEVNVVGEAKSGRKAIAMVERLRPDLVLLEIDLPDLNGLTVADVLRQQDARLLIVFVAGSAEHAADAFECGPLDYLVKPVTAARLVKALERAQARVNDRQVRRQGPPEGSGPSTRPPSLLPYLPIHTDFALVLVPFEEIVCAVTQSKHVEVRTVAKNYATTYTLKELEARLPADLFLRVHVSVLVNLASVRQVDILGGRTYQVQLENGDRHRVGRRQWASLRLRLGLADTDASR